MRENRKKIKNIVLITLLLILTLSFVLSGCTTVKGLTKIEKRPDNELHIMSYNIRTNPIIGSKGKMDKWSYRKNVLIKHINMYAPDIVGMQEVMPEQLLHIKHNLSSAYENFGRSRGPFESSGEGVFTFYNKEKFELIEKDIFWVSDKPYYSTKYKDAGAKRIVVYTKFAIKNEDIAKEDRQELVVFNTHLDHLSSKAQAKGVDMVLDRITKLKGSGSIKENTPVVLLGDFNFDKESPNYDKLTASLVDTQSIAEETKGEITFHNYGLSKEPSLYPIDFIFMTPNSLNIKSHLILEEKVDGRNPSDHYPVLIKAEFN